MQATIHDIERLFGTSDLNALEQIARKWAAAGANPRGAGRKKKFALDEVVAMKAMQQDGATEAQLAKRSVRTFAACMTSPSIRRRTAGSSICTGIPFAR